MAGPMRRQMAALVLAVKEGGLLCLSGLRPSDTPLIQRCKLVVLLIAHTHVCGAILFLAVDRESHFLENGLRRVVTIVCY